MNEKLKNVVAAVIFVSFIASLVYGARHNKEQVNIPTSVELKIDNVNVQQLADLVNRLPDGPFKSNLYTVLAAELGGTSKELNTLLMEYVRLQIEKLQKIKTI